MSVPESVAAGIAIVGVAGRFPGARDVAEFWRNLVGGADGITRFTDEQLAAAGYDPAMLRSDPGFVPARGVLDRPEWFDAAFFGIQPKEAEAIDPQHRVFMETAWHALEDAGCDPSRYPGLIGVFAGMSNNTYGRFVYAKRELVEAVGELTAMLGNEKDYLTTRLAYKLNLRGPAISIATACSTSLVAIAQACQSLAAYQCDAAIAGGVSITFPQERGYFFREGGMTSPDGVCRPFDAQAAGAVFSHGCGAVVLKRLADALADGDQIYAVVKGWALNNDGAGKVSITAPSVDGQAEVIALAQALAGVTPESIGYVEAHGTGTPMGDPIEVAALAQVFSAETTRRQFCALGSLKSNIGHLEAASGVAGFIKAALALRHARIPATLHFQQPNPELRLEESPFYVAAETAEWPRGAEPRRAGVSSFGVGGTNAHAVLEEAPELPPTAEGRPAQVFTLSAKTASALNQAATDLAAHLAAHATLPLADAALTLQTGRQIFPHRRAVVARTVEEAVAALSAAPKNARHDDRHETPVAFIFPGQGSQYPRMGAQLYASEPAFRAAFDIIADLLQPELGLDLRATIFSGDPAELRQTRLTQPALFAIEYALAQMWMSFGVQPVALLGHSVGEYVAATLAGVFSLADAARLIAARARLVQAQPGGTMLAVRLGENEVREYVSDQVSIAAINSSRLCVLSGPSESLAAIEAQLTTRAVPVRRLATSHAFHSAMVEPVVAPFTELVRGVTLHPPQIPFVSNVTGDWITAEQATDPAYWAGHVRAAVRFADGLGRLLEGPPRTLLEVGPGNTLTQLARQHPAKNAAHEFASTIAEDAHEASTLATAQGRLWTAGVPLDWSAIHAGEIRRRISLPGYPFERQRYFADLPAGTPLPLTAVAQDGEPLVEAAASRNLPVAPSSESSSATATPAVPPVVAEAALPRLKALINEQSGLDLSTADASTTLLDLGFDSLFLSQLIISIQKRFRVRVTLTELFDDFSTLGALAAHLDAKAPALPNTSPAAPTTTSAPVPSSGTAPLKSHGPFRPVQKDLGASLSPSQQQWLDDFLARYTQRTAGSKEYTQRHRARLSDPRAVSGFKLAWKEMIYPIVAGRSDGSKIWDIDGHEYIDITLGFGVGMLGHRPPYVVEAVKEQLDLGFEIGPTSPLTGEVADLVCELTGMERAAFCNTGSEAVMGALRVARTVTGRDKVVYFTGAYHGIFDEVLAHSVVVNGQLQTRAIAPGIPQESVNNAIILDYGDPRSLEYIRAHADEIAAVLVEPVQSRRPDLQPGEFLRELGALTKETQTVLIFDEVVTGWRCHQGGAQAYFGVRADLATYGKVVGGGIPIGIIAGRADLLDSFDGGPWQFGDDSAPGAPVTFFAGTFVRWPLALAAAKAVLLHLKKEGPQFQEKLTERAAGMVDRIRAILAGTPFEAPRFTSNWYLRPQPDFKFSALFFALLRYRGLHIWENRPCFLSTAHTDADIDRVVTIFEESVAEMIEAGFFIRQEALPEGALPSAEAQREVWLACQLSPLANAALNETCTIHFAGEFDSAAMQRAIQIVVDRHEALRTTFSNDGTLQIVLPALTLEVPVTDLSALPVEERATRRAALQAAEGLRPFDLARAPLVALQILQLDATSHDLIFTAHHIACDGWSYDVVLRELGVIYTALREGRPHDLPAPMQMRDYQRWETEQQRGADFAADQAFWLERFQTLPPPLDLPGDRPRPAQRSHAGSREIATLPAELYQQVTQTATRLGSTPFVLLLAAFNALLYRLSGERDLVVGVPAAGQNLAGGADLVGHCVNLLALRSAIEDTGRFTEFLRATRKSLFAAVEHQRFNFGQLVRQLPLPRDPSRMPLISSTFNLDPPLSDIRYGSLRHEIALNPRAAYQFDLSFNCVEDDGALEVQCDYNTDLFDAATIRRWLAHYRTLLTAIIAAPETPLAQLPLIDPGERAALLELGRGPANDFPADTGLAELFSRRAAAQPTAIAVVESERRFTYAEVEERANQVANHLLGIGLKPGEFVGLRSERSARFIWEVVGVLRAGGAYVPVAADEPVERMKMIEKTCAVLLLAPEPYATASTSPVELTVDAGGPAYLLFTSGSTGIPKGVVVPHRAVTRLVWNTNYVEFRQDDVVAFASNLNFDAATFEIWGALLRGGALLVTPHEVLLSTAALEAHLTNHRVTILFLTTSLFNRTAQAAPAIFRQLRYMVFGGEAANAESVRLVLENGKPGHLVNGYGPTETTTFAICHEVTQVDGAFIPIGRPIANTDAFILDAQREPVPRGVAGEIYLGGPGLALGYHHDPELTAERFLETVLGRLYRTGDLARWLPDGTIEYLGRRDQQIKLRGYRIEPGEIETALKQLPSIRDAAVVLRQDHDNPQLVAYCVRRKSDPILLWPSTPSAGGEQEYDDLLYWAMSNDHVRNEYFKAACARHVPGKVVLDAGTGKDAILARLAVEAGARKVYGVELLEKPAQQAKDLIKSLGLEDRITIIQGDLREIELPELADVLVSENLGHIGGAEGWDFVLNYTHRHLKPGAPKIPPRALTCLAAVSLPEEFLKQPRFAPLAKNYAQRLWDTAGYKYDLRLMLSGTSRALVRSTEDVFEDLDLAGPVKAEYERPIRLEITEDTKIDGFLLWLRIEMTEGLYLDCLDNAVSWYPVYLPAFYPAITVQKGDVIRATVRGLLAENGFNRDYFIAGEIIRGDGRVTPFDFKSYHYKENYKTNAFYEKLFARDRIETGEEGAEKVVDLAVALRSKLPKFMIPSAFVYLEHLPLTANGKLDRDALPPPPQQLARPTSPANPNAPMNQAQSALLDIWRDLLKHSNIGIRDNFFEIGGNSLLVAVMLDRFKQRMGMAIGFAEVHDHPTIEGLAEVLSRRDLSEREKSPVVEVQTSGAGSPFYFFHGHLFGARAFCNTLAAEFGESRPFYGINPHGVDGELPPSTIEAMAESRMQALRKLQPKGPYYLGGYCNGGYVAFEVARLLEAAGEEVAAVLLHGVDGSNVHFDWVRRLTDTVTRFRGESGDAQRSTFIHWRDRLAFLGEGSHAFRVSPELPLVKRTIDRARKAKRFAMKVVDAVAKTPVNGGPVDSDPFTQIVDAACNAYIPKSLRAKAVVLWPKDQPSPTPGDPSAEWRKVCSEVEVRRIPGGHRTSITEPANLRSLGREMRDALDALEKSRNRQRP